jgi:hypothetical protein
MAIEIKLDSRVIVKLENLNLEREDSNNFFELSGSSTYLEHPLEIQLSYILDLYDDYNPDDYQINILYNENFAENDIYQIYEKTLDKRIGWMFPLQALMSKEHDFSENVHFLKYAYVAFNLLLSNEDMSNRKIADYSSKDNYSLFDFYPPNSIVFVFSKQAISEINDFNIVNYFPCLYEYGFIASEKGKSKALTTTETKEKIYIKSISDDVKEEGFILQLFKELLVNEDHHLVKFYLLYQVIELLIEKIFNKELKNIIDQLSTGSSNLFQVKDKLGDISKEKKRINKLFNNYTSSQQYKTILREKCNILLSNLNREEKDSPAESLYSVRNLLVHEYRSILEPQIALIYDINETFELLVIEILSEVNNIAT